MGQMKWQDEIERLQKLYRSKSDEELAKVGSDPASFTDVARGVLDEELASRKLPSLAAQAERLAEEARKEQALRPVMIRRYRDLPEAAVAQSILDSAGIESFLADENIVRLDWFYSNLIGGIKLLVHDEDVESANRVLDETPPEKFTVEGVGEYELPHCPACASVNTSLDGLNKPVTFGAMFLTNLPIPINRKGWKCHACGHSWTEQDDHPADPAPVTEGTN